jgi:hypothetical protein
MDLLPVTNVISALRPKVTREHAVAMLSRGVLGTARRMVLGPLRSVAEIYVPFRVYRVTGRGRRAALLAIDAVTGELDLYQFDSIPDSTLLADVRTRNRVPARLSIDTNRDLLQDRMKRLTYQRVGFLAAPRFALKVEPIEPTLHVPYWVGFFGSGEVAAPVVIDAVRRQVEGAKARRLVVGWLTEADRLSGGYLDPNPICPTVSGTARGGARS